MFYIVRKVKLHDHRGPFGSQNLHVFILLILLYWKWISLEVIKLPD